MPRPIFDIHILPGTMHMWVNIREIPRAALSLVYKIDPRIITKEFYDLDPMQRRIILTPRRMLEASGRPHEAQQIHGHETLASQISVNDAVFKLTTHGHPRSEETWYKWLEACAVSIDLANQRRAADQVKALAEMDRDIGDWLTGVGAMDEDVLAGYVKPCSTLGTWTIAWNRLPFSENKVEDLAMRSRLREMAVAQGADTVREYFLMRPETERVARAIDGKVGVSEQFKSRPPAR